MVVRRERVPDAILVVMMLAVGDVFCVAHGHLFTTVPKTMVKKGGKHQTRERLHFKNYALTTMCN